MSEPTFLKFQLEPELTQAIDRWLQATKDEVDNISVAKNAINPFQSFVQTSIHTLKFLADIDWFGLYAKPNWPDSYNQIFDDFNQLQQAAYSRISKDQHDLLDTLVKDGKDFIDTAPGIDNPQTVVANYINKSIDSYEEVKESMSNLTQTAVSLQSAYMAWYQQSLAALAGEDQTHSQAAK